MGASSKTPSLNHSTVRYRLGVASRALAAIGGGYALAAGSTIALALALRSQPREEAVMLATLPSYLIWAGAVIWVFAARTAGRAWLGLLVPGLALGAAIWVLRNGGGA
jgi:hypothetical protein